LLQMKLPKKTTAAILVELHKPLIVDSIELPHALSFGQVLVKIHYTTICGSQINEIAGAKGPDKYLPHLLGHEASATVLAIGDGVRTVGVGDPVVMHWRPSDGLQAEPASYTWKKNPLHAGWVTTFQKHAVVSENRLTTIPQNFDRKIAPLLGCAVTTAMGVVNNDAQIKVGQSVVVLGAGGVGLNIIQAASMVSAYPIIAVDIVKEKLTLAKKFGASYTFHSPTQKDFKEKILEIVGSKGADIVIDTTGSARVIEMCYNLTHSDGKTILVGVPKIGDNISIYSLPLHFNKILKGSHGGSSVPHVDIPRLIRLYQAGKLSFRGMITHQFVLEQINVALDLVRSGKAGRVVLKMDDGK
jgi:S-(hydroxymethyl)glutathione dehydrogenase/alcohol dehydrogenase